MADEGLPEGVIEVGRVPAKGGGYWVLGDDGGVFALGGAQYYGSYPGLNPSLQTGYSGKFRRIDATYEGGYSLEDVNGKRLVFNPPPTTQPTVEQQESTAVVPAATTGPVEGTPMSGEAILRDVFTRYGLDPQFAVDLLDEYRRTGSQDAAYIMMRNDERYKKRFKGMELRREKGYDPITEQQYVEWEGTARRLMDKYNIPKEFYDDDDELAAFIGGDVDPGELKTRIEDGYLAAYSAPPEYRQALQQMYGVDDGQLAAFWLDPEVGEKIIQKRWTAAQIGGEALKSEFGGLTQAEAERLADAGVNRQQAQAGFDLLDQQAELMGALPGQSGEGVISRETQLGSVDQSNLAAQEAIRKQGRRRSAVFQQGGGVAEDARKGLTGLGEAT